MNTADRLMTVKELAEMLCVPVSTMYGWRSRRQGPPWLWHPPPVRYRRQLLKPGWLAGGPMPITKVAVDSRT
jgi:hypothetical protein